MTGCHLIVCICHANELDSYLVRAEEMLLGTHARQGLRH